MSSSTLDRALLITEMSGAERFPVGPGEVAAYSAACPGRQINEDSACALPIDERNAILAVADGLGGHPGGARASRLCLETLCRHVRPNGETPRSMRAAILDGIEQASRNVQALGVGAGTTLAVVQIESDTIRTYHVGDSEILVVGQRGKVKLHTVSHSPVSYGVQAGLINEREAVLHEDRHLLSNVLGSPEMRIEIGPITTLAPRDRVLVASDGLFDNLHLDEIIEIIRKGALTQSASTLARKARDRMRRIDERLPTKPDDLTFLLFQTGRR